MDQWESIAAFGDLAELEHVCELLHEAAAVSADQRDEAEYLTGEKSTLSSRLVQQARYSEATIEAARPGLYRRTWIAELFGRLFLRLDEVTEFPARLAGELRDIELDLHKVLIAAHDVIDPECIAKLVAVAEAQGVQKGEDNAKKQRSVQSRSAVGARADQKERDCFLTWGRAAIAAGVSADNVDDLQGLDGFNIAWSKRSLATLKNWAKEAGFSFKAGRPKNKK